MLPFENQRYILARKARYNQDLSQVLTSTLEYIYWLEPIGQDDILFCIYCFQDTHKDGIVDDLFKPLEPETITSEEVDELIGMSTSLWICKTPLLSG